MGVEVIKEVTLIMGFLGGIGVFYYIFCGFGRSLVNTYESSGLNMTNYFQRYGPDFSNYYHLSLKVMDYVLHLSLLLCFGKYLLKRRIFDDIENLDSIFSQFTKKQITQTKCFFFCWVLFVINCLLYSLIKYLIQ